MLKNGAPSTALWGIPKVRGMRNETVKLRNRAFTEVERDDRLELNRSRLMPDMPERGCKNMEEGWNYQWCTWRQKDLAGKRMISFGG